MLLLMWNYREILFTYRKNEILKQRSLNITQIMAMINDK